MQLTFLGGADEVGASSTLIEISGKKILVDAGIRISPRSNRGIEGDQLPDLHPITAVGGLDYLLVTHAHTDHTGALPLVVEQYPHIPVLATRPTIDLTRILQADAQRIMKTRQEEEGELPIFDEVASNRLMEAFQTVEFNQPIRLGEGLQVTYHVSGHIAGAATLVFESDEGVLVISGDVSLNDQRAVRSAKIPPVKADALVLESTYGGKLHANRMAEERRLIDSLSEITARGGKALIPAFALGRAQEVLQIILAYRDRLDIPVYVDGMVRSVCRGYVNFADLLPEKTVKSAGDSHLFFREKIKPVDNPAMREALTNGEEPCVIVASSGMLTGGASALYAKTLAGDARNAILLTGYQDEESPGKALQRLVKEREEEESATIKIDGKPVTVRCSVGTYSLSAHADENELVSMAEAMNADEVMLVHGDPTARHSLATALRQRERKVSSPRVGQTITLKFASRPWALGRVEGMGETRPLDPKVLWERLKEQAGSFFSARELAQMWWGETTRSGEAARALMDTVYFAPDWRSRNTFQVHTVQQVETMTERRKVMREHPDLVGQLVVLRDSNNRPRVGVVAEGGIDAFEADVYQAKGRHYPADSLLWALGKWEGYPEGNNLKEQVGAFVNAAKGLDLLTFPQRQALVGKPVQPESLLPDDLPGASRQLALLAVVLALAGDGAVRVPGGLMSKRAHEGGALEQNQAREVTFSIFPPEARLRKVGMEVHRKRITLTFDFPERAAQQFADEIDAVEEQTEWEVVVKPGVNQQALGAVIEELLPEGAKVVKGPSFFLDKSEVAVELAGVDDLPALEQTYLNLTGYKLKVARKANTPSAQPVAPTKSKAVQMEINAAYKTLKDALEPFGLYRAGLKGDAIALTFISPQVGERHRDLIAALAEQIGYALSIHPHPNQQQIIQTATTLLREADVVVRKGPGIHVDRAEVTATVAALPSSVDLLTAKFEQETGYRLVLNV